MRVFHPVQALQEAAVNAKKCKEEIQQTFNKNISLLIKNKDQLFSMCQGK